MEAYEFQLKHFSEKMSSQLKYETKLNYNTRMDQLYKLNTAIK